MRYYQISFSYKQYTLVAGTASAWGCWLFDDVLLCSKKQTVQSPKGSGQDVWVIGVETPARIHANQQKWLSLSVVGQLVVYPFLWQYGLPLVDGGLSA